MNPPESLHSPVKGKRLPLAMQKTPQLSYVGFRHLQISLWKFSVCFLADRRRFLFSLKQDQGLCSQGEGWEGEVIPLDLNLSL